MTCRQTVSQWLILDRPDIELMKRLPRGSGVFLLSCSSASQERQIRRLGRSRGLTVVREAPQTGARVHNLRELTHALLRKPSMILLSPLYPTATHPDWKPLPRMRAAALARLADRRAIALGGMNSRRYATIVQLGFKGWAGISAFRT